MTAARHQDARAPDPWVIRHAPAIPRGPVLDLACGGGRHGRYLLERGRRVSFLDRDLSGVADLRAHPRATLLEHDLENGSPWPFAAEQFAGIVVVNYLHRPLFPALADSLRRPGMLIYRSFARGHERFGRPSNPAFLLEEDELLRAFGATLEVVDFEQGYRPDPERVVQALCAVRR